MTPLELNKKIAELKGFHSIRNGFSDSVFYCDKEKLGNEFLNYNKNWSENISDAWELFEEMPYPAISKHYSDYICSFDSSKALPLNKFKSAPEAICVAWIKWMEGS